MSEQPMHLRVAFSSLEDARRLVHELLAVARQRRLSDEERARLSSRIAAGLRDAGLLGQTLEQCYSAADVGALCGGRTSAWAVKHARLGDFGPVFCDGGDWLIPASGVQEYLQRHRVTTTADVQEAQAA